MPVRLPRLNNEGGAFSDFLHSNPDYIDTLVIDSLRKEEYPHLDEKHQACFDYNGIGLFSSSQKFPEFNGGTGVATRYTSANLATHAMYPETGTVESYMRKRILNYLNLDEDEYYIVFTANAFSAFKLLGVSYPFHEAQNLLLAYDHQCDNVDAIVHSSILKSTIVQSVDLLFPTLTIDTDDLQKKLHGKKKMFPQGTGVRKGLFVYPYSSRVTGCKNSSRWISEAQQNGWHVLLDVTSVDAKMLDSLGLSLFLPDFVIASFYNIFGEDPTGLGALAVKKSVLKILGDSSRARAIGMVQIVKKTPSSVSSSSSARNSTDHEVNGNQSQASESFDENFSGSVEGAFQPELSADVTNLDSTAFFRSDSDEICFSNTVSHNIDTRTRTASKQQSDAIASTSWQSEIMSQEGMKPLYSHDTNLINFHRGARNWGADGSSLLRKANVRGLFYGESKCPLHYTSLKALLHQDESGCGDIVHKTNSIDTLVVDWSTFCARQTKTRLSRSSSFSAPTSPTSYLQGRENYEEYGNNIMCKGLDHAELLGYKRIAVRLRLLSKWLVSSLSHLRHPQAESNKLVRIYSQMSSLDWVSTVAFTLVDPAGNPFELNRVQMLADRNNISLRTGLIMGTFCSEQFEQRNNVTEDFLTACMEFAGYKWRVKGDSVHSVQLPVIYVSLGFLNNFADVYRLWSFVSKFLDPEFINKEQWHYQALNQETIQI